MQTQLWLVAARGDLPNDDDPWVPWHDKCFGVVVEAQNEAEARSIAHENGGNERTKYVGENRIKIETRAWLDPKRSTCVTLQCTGVSHLVIRNFTGL